MACLSGLALAAEELPPTDSKTLEKVVELIQTMDGSNVGALFRAVRAVNKSKGAIVTMRELNKAMKEGNLGIDTSTSESINAKMTAAQKQIKDMITGTRVEAHEAFAAAKPEAARTLSADGDVGSWRTSDDINSDVDWTAFGADPNVTADFVEHYNTMLLDALAGEGSGLNLKEDFDIVVTPEGSEAQAGVFETRGGKKLAMTVMTVVTPVNADGTLGVGIRSDIGAELENTKAQARLRALATKLNVYDQFFDDRGHFKSLSGTEGKPADAEKQKGWLTFMEAADDEGLLTFDFNLVKSATLAGTCVDMAKHLHHEAIEQLGTLDKKGQIKRIMKYPGRSEWAYGRSSVPDQLIEDYVIMGNPKIRTLIEQSAKFHAAKEAKGRGSKEALDAMIDRLVNEYPDSEELGHLALEMIVRQSHLAMMLQLDRIATVTDAGERGKQLQELITDFTIAADGGALDAYAKAQIEALTAFKNASDDPVAFEAVRKARKSVVFLSDEANRTNLERVRAFMKETELGRKILDTHDNALALADKMKKKVGKAAYQIDQIRVEVSVAYERLKEGSELLQFVEATKESWKDYSDTVGAPAKGFVETANRLATFVDGIEAIRDSKTDSDLAYNLGKALWNNSGIGGLVNTLYAFTVGGDNEAMAKFIMFALCPEAAVPDLVNKIGGFALRGGAQRLFDAQLDALYRNSGFSGDPKFAELPQWKGKDPWLLADFVDYGAGVPAVVAFLDDLLRPGGYKIAEDMIAKKSAEKSDIERGNEAIAKTAVVKAIWTTLQLGDQIVLRDDGPLAEATQRIKFLTDQIIDLAKHMGKEVPRVHEYFVMPDGVSPGEQAALNKMVKERGVWVDKAKTAMAEAIARSFEERRRADSDLSDKAMEKRLAELIALLTRLDIVDPALGHLSGEGSYDFSMRTAHLMNPTKNQQRKMMEAINRYFDAYTQISSLREAISQLAQVQTGAPLDKRPLTGAPPLCGERSIDVQNAQPFFEKVRTANDDTSRSLVGLKGSPLAGPFDDRIRHGVNAAVIAMAQADMAATIASTCRDLISKFHMLDRQSFTDFATQSMQTYEAARLKRDALMTEFTTYYAGIKALNAQISATPAAPLQGQPVEAVLRVVGGQVPAEATWRWTLEDDGRVVASAEGATFRFQAPVRSAYELKAALMITGVAVKTVSRKFTVLGPPALRLALAPANPDPAATLMASASWSSNPPGGDAITYDWQCDGCTIVAQQGARASVQAPNDGGAVIRVKARASSDATGATLAETSIAFQVNPPKKPNAQTSKKDPAGPTQPLILPGSSNAKPPTKDPNAGATTTLLSPSQQPNSSLGSKDQDKPAGTAGSIADLPIGTWREAMTARDRYRELSQRTDLSAQDKTRAAERLANADNRLRALWTEARDDVTGLPAFVNRYIVELDRIYAGFRAKAPKKPDKPDQGGTVVDLDGETPWSRYQCVIRMDQELAEKKKQAQEIMAQATSVQAMFARAYDVGSGYAPAMQAFDALWPGQYLFSRKWRTTGLNLSLSDPCGEPGTKTALKLDPVGAATPATPVVEKKPAPTVNLAIDPASKGKSDIVVVATATGGVAPYRYRWIGARSDSGEHAVYAAPLSNTANARATVQVSDASGGVASAEIVLDVVPLVVQLVKTAPTGADLPVGGQATFAVRLTIDGKLVDASSYVLRWEPSTEARFQRAEGVGIATNSATFARPGNAKVWVVALQRVGAALATAGESAQIELNVVGANIALKFEPASPLVGQEVKVTATETPPVSDKDATYWWEYVGQAATPGPTTNPRVYSFVPKNAKPITVTAHLKEKLHGDELASKSVTVAAAPFAVSVANLGPMFENSTMRPVVWRQGKGLVTLDKEIVAHQDVLLRADITPAPVTSQLRYKWTVGDGASVSGNPAARETRVQRASVGTIQTTVEVRDANDIVLGSGSTSISVTISDADIATGKSKSAELAKLKDESAKAWADGDLDGACDKGKAAGQIEPGFALAATYCSNRGRILSLLGQSEAALAKGGVNKSEIDRAQSLFDQAKAINPKAKPLADLARKIANARKAPDGAAALLAKAASAWQAGEAATAVRLAEEAAAQTPPLAEVQQARKRYVDGLAGLVAAVGKAKAALAKKDYDGALATVADGKKLLANYKPLIELEQEVAKAKQGDAQNSAERQRRLQALQAGTQACTKQNWQECKAKLEPALTGADKIFKQEDTAIVDQARKLLAKATQELAGAKDAKAPPNKQPDSKQVPAVADKTQQERQCGELATAAVGKQQSGDSRGAIPLFEQALSICPSMCTTIGNLAVAYNAVGNQSSAKDRAAAAMRCDPNNDSIKKIAVSLGVVPPQNSAQTSDAKKPNDTAKADKERQCQDLVNAAVVKHQAGDARGAIPLYEQALSQCPAMCTSMLNLGLAYNATGNASVAKEKAAAAMRCDPKNEAIKAKAVTLGVPMQQPPTQPQNNAQSSSGQQPADTIVDKEKQCRSLATTAIGKQQVSDFKGAIPLYEQSLQLCPTLCPVMSNLSVAYNVTGNQAAAKQWATAATRCDPNNELYKRNAAAIGVAPQPQPTQPNKPPTPPNISSSRFDGVYIGSSRTSEGHDSKTQFTWTVAGSQISVVTNVDPRKWTGKIKPTGELTISILRNVWTGRIVGDAISGTWRLPMSLSNGPEIVYTGTFAAKRVGVQAAPNQPAAQPHPAAPPNPQPPSPQPPKAASAGADGVYVGSIDGENRSFKCSWVVSGRRIAYSYDADPEKKQYAGDVAPNGEFAIHTTTSKSTFGTFAERTYRGKIIDNRLSGTYDVRYFIGEKLNKQASGTFSASHTK